MVIEIFDGEIHVLSEEYAYILDFLKSSHTIDEMQISHEKILEFSKKYAEYLLLFNKEKVMKILVNYIMPNHFGSTYDEDYEFIMRKPQMISSSAKYGTIAMKFKRATNDNITA